MFFFIIAHIILFITYGSLYSTKMQAIQAKEKLFKVPRINKNKLQSQIQAIEMKIVILKKYTLIALIIISVSHVLFEIFTQEKYGDYGIILSIAIAAVGFLFRFIITWLKGAGTIDNLPRFDDNGI